MMQQAQVVQMLGPYRGAAYAAQFFVGMTLFGAASIQLREIAKGRDPRPMDNVEFWEDAAFQGGGLGIFGDLLGSFTSSRIDSLAGFALGPFYGLVKRSEEHTSELQSLMRISYAVFCLKKKKTTTQYTIATIIRS